MATTPKGTDRRVQRTRQIIRQAFIEIVGEKGLMAASIQEVTERANVSRGTFYSHYADKYELVDSIMREEFQRAVSTLPLSSGWHRKTLHVLIKTMLEYFKSIYQHHHRSRDIATLLERTIHEELKTLILALLKQDRNQEIRSSLSLEAIAQIISWTIFGAAIQWSEENSTISSEQMTHDIVLMIMDGVARLLPEGPPAAQ